MMKAILLIIAGILGFNTVKGQCRISGDSVSEGLGMTAHTQYVYASGKLVKRCYLDSGDVSFSTYDTILYDSKGLFVRVDKYTVDNAIPYEEVEFVRNGDDQIIRVNATGNNGLPWSLSHDVVYKGQDIHALTMDLPSISGFPPILDASFTNVTWVEGNVKSANFVANFGKGEETIALAFTYDDKNNLQRLTVPSNADDLLFFYGNNNLLKSTTLNNASIGPAGSNLLNQIYAYNNSEEVIKVTLLPSLFRSEVSVIDFKLDCLTNVIEEEGVKPSLRLFPNPSSGFITLQLDNMELEAEKLTILNVYGQIIKKILYKKGPVSIHDLPAGIYFLRINTTSGTLVKRFTKK